MLYGSNLGTAEELATRVADLAEINGYATKLGPLDEFSGKLPDKGGVLIFCASYNGAPPDNAAQFIKWLSGDLAKNALDGVRYAVFGCGNSDWAATYQSIPRLIDQQLAAHGARGVYPRGEGDARDDLDGQFEGWFAKLNSVAVKEFGIAASFVRNADDEPLYKIEPVAPTAVNTIVALGGAAPMKVLANGELQNKSGANASERSTRHIEVQLPSGTSYRVGDHLSVVPRNDPALVDSVARRFGFLPADQIRLQVAEGRRAQLPVGDTVSVGRLLSEFVELQQVATRKQIQIMSENTRCPVTKPKLVAYLGDDAAATELYRSEILGKRKSVFDLWKNIRPANCRSTLILKCCRCWRRAITRSRRRRRAIHRGAASPSPWSRVPRVPGAASTKASARITWPAAAPARRSMPRFARPRPASGCQMIPPCRSS